MMLNIIICISDSTFMSGAETISGVAFTCLGINIRQSVNKTDNLQWQKYANYRRIQLSSITLLCLNLYMYDTQRFDGSIVVDGVVLIPMLYNN